MVHHFMDWLTINTPLPPQTNLLFNQSLVVFYRLQVRGWESGGVEEWGSGGRDFLFDL